MIGEGAVVENSVIGLRCRIGRGAVVRNSVIMGADEYDCPSQMARDQQTITQGIGAGAHIEGAIIDKNCRIGRNVRIINERGVETSPETAEAMINDGIVIIQKGAVLPDGWTL